ncbi:MAG: hypothetical protein Q4G69_12080 [Planctomycetia bacterium]|nr:hypothetical protein [Planctomycetia bacterium]
MNRKRIENDRKSFASESIGRRSLLLIVLFSFMIAFSQSAGFAKESSELAVIQCDTFCYKISPEGKNIAFIDKADGKNYLKKSENENEYCSCIKKGEKTFLPDQVRFDGNILFLHFTDGTDAEIQISNQKDRLMFEVLRISGSPDSFVFLNIPLTLKAIPDEPFAACALSQNVFTHVHQLPALQRALWACAYQRFGYIGARAAVVGVPQKNILPVIRDIMKKAAPDVPFSDQGGAWALQAKEGYGSYLMNFASLTEGTVNAWIEACKTIGFNQIDNHGGNPGFYLFGSLEINKDRFPEGWKSFKKVVDQLHRAGISSILHTYACYISPTAKYITPVPSPDLDYLKEFTLAGPISENADEILVQESTADACKPIGYTETSNRTIKIGNEIIQYSGAAKEAPYKFTGCKRGWHNTAKSAHKAGEKAGLLKTFWNGLYVPRPGSALWEEIAKNHADVVNECGFDGIYFDAIEGIRSMWGEENYWYYGSKFVFDVMKHLKKPIGVEYAGMMHHWWHYRSRYQAWDKPRRGYKRFMDIHIASMKAGEEYQHGCWEGHLPEIEKYAGMKNCGLYLPLQLGWTDMHTWGGPKMEPTFFDDIEYVCCKMIGNNAGLSMTGGFDPNPFPAFLDYAKMIARYEKLRYARYFDEKICAELRKPGKEFTLYQNSKGQWGFKPVFYKKHKVLGLDHSSAKWTVQNEFKAQPVHLRLEVLMSCAPWNDSRQTTLINAENIKDFNQGKSAEGVQMELLPAGKDPNTGELSLFLSGKNTKAPRDASWTFKGKKYDPPINLGNKMALGVWIKGDGLGELVNFRLENSAFHYGKSDHFIKADFNGWRYFELIESESSAISEYVWPKTKGYFVYSNYRESANYKVIDSFQIWFNNLQAGKKSEILLGPVKALECLPIEIENPTIEINGQKMILPVKMKTGMYLELFEDGLCNLRDQNSKLVQQVKPVGEIPVLKKGENQLSFTCDSQNKISTRVQLTVSAQGDPL